MDGRRSDNTSAIIDNVLRLLVTGSVITAGLALPGLLVGLDKPLHAYLNRLDKRARDREFRRIVYYMKSRKFVRGDYEYGLQITKKGRQRLAALDLDGLEIKPPKRWDGKWRLILYDIPESHKRARNLFARRLYSLGLYQLQRSAWIHPFPCRSEIESLASAYSIDTYISYLETGHIDNQQTLLKHFAIK